MEEIAISKFKATCLSVMERVRKTKKPVRVTRFGEPVAEIVPPTPPPPPKSWIGAMGTTTEHPEGNPGVGVRTARIAAA